jgi:hypothetical protein
MFYLFENAGRVGSAGEEALLVGAMNASTFPRANMPLPSKISSTPGPMLGISASKISPPAGAHSKQPMLDYSASAVLFSKSSKEVAADPFRLLPNQRALAQWNGKWLPVQFVRIEKEQFVVKARGSEWRVPRAHIKESKNENEEERQEEPMKERDKEINKQVIETNSLVEAESVVNVGDLACKTFAVGETVDVVPRTWVGINKPGGIGRVVKTNDDGTYNVKYVLGGLDKKVPPPLDKSSNRFR